MRKLFSWGSLALALATSALLALPVQAESKADDTAGKVTARASQDNNLSAESLQALEQQAKSGEVDALVMLGALYYGGGFGLEQDFNKALDYLSEAADKGDTDAMVIMADMYANGLGVEENLEKALDLLVVAAEKGNKDAQDMLIYINENSKTAEDGATK